MRLMTEVLKERLGEADIAHAAEVIARDWGPPLNFEAAEPATPATSD